MISNDVEGLAAGEGNYATFLSATGKILADFYYYRFQEYVLIDIAGELLEGFVETLSKYIIMDDVNLEDISAQIDHYSVEGPKSGELLRAILKDDLPSGRLKVHASRWEGSPLWWLRKDELASPGFEVILPKTVSRKFQNSLVEKGAALGIEQTSSDAFELLRMEKGIPINGIDFSQKNNPVEARLSGAYSLTKGCYVGQEVVSKATLVGSVPKALSRLKIEGELVPEREASIFESDGKEIGWITSAVWSPLLKQPIALAFLRKGFWDPGQVHQVEGPSSERLRAEVVDGFE
jgi:folate-binding protein YgfZ